ncbi:MAG: hypothetical protein A2748_00500 [Candidatus Wildermuthbacteria bacterium RIFCSPHIGHO2_01_FULL_45_20]|uniref:Uncharacterized protein n=1 Tax=Candidatus Wildermuthbacteria bacterium RIFCSPHIGHO2_02_FULL_45_25 TaxID=1802450 RepID=A0A1G2R5Y9_9BACT|nr:MAG: hypothetical protein A2748_00500 [Candidatus Wildermuthbacteria bacterium RIFCSPHIGHO2_01_FULL_45_20]OHA67662.1 MAG: hypothetical protein A3C04_01960 [Candidatus Wildermuthbacteria bacterium RIFCSPHIGHO2_02_FULL_45_25]
MKLFVTVKAGAKQNIVEKIGANEFKVTVKEPSKEGKANLAVIDLLSEYFDAPKNNVRIVSGLGAKKKIVQING